MAFQCINYLKLVGDNAERVFNEAVKLRCRHVSTASWQQMHKDRTINCNGSGAIALQLSDCLDTGTRMGHVDRKSIKEKDITSINKAMYNADKIRNCRIIWVGKKESDLPFWLKRRGVIYIQYSNCCTSAGMIDGKHWIWSCNEEGGYHRQKDGSMRYDQYKETRDRSGVLSCGGHYPFGPKIYVCILPYEKWDQHFAIEVMLEKHGKKETRQDHFGNHYEKIQKMVDRMCRDNDYFCWWAADYIFERYGTINDFYKPGHFDYRKEVQECINNIDRLAHETWAGKHGGEKQRRKDFGDLFDFVQRQVNRTTS